MNNIPLTRLDEIAEEVMNLIGVSDVFEFLDDSLGDPFALDARLQEVMLSRQSFETVEIAMYLRASSNRSEQLPTWQPLLNAAVEMSRLRGERVDDIFYGMIESRSEPRRNTR